MGDNKQVIEYIVRYDNDVPVEIFVSMGTAAKEYQVSVTAIRQAVVLGTKCQGYHWKKYNINKEDILKLIN